MQWWKLVGFFGVSVALFSGGYKYAASLYGEQISLLREEYANRAQALEAQYRAKEQKINDSLMYAWEQRDKALSHAANLTNDVDRLRREAEAARSRLSARKGDPRNAERKQLARCSKVVERGGELVERCTRLLERTAIDKDAIVKIVQ